MKIKAIDLKPTHNGTVIRFTGKKGDLTYKTRMRLGHFTTYSDYMKLADEWGDTYNVDFDTLVELEENK